jgi:hypothetical protein
MVLAYTPNTFMLTLTLASASSWFQIDNPTVFSPL